MSRTRCHAGRGFTLIEMLVTLVIVSMVVTLVAQSMYQATRLEQRLAHASTQGAQASLQREWVRRLLSGVLPMRQDSAERLRGDASTVQGLSNAVPAFPDDVTGPFLLRLRSRPDGMELTLSASQASDAPAVVLLSWQGRAGAFRYLDGAGVWHDQWPPAPSGPGPALVPRAIALESNLNSVRWIVANVSAQGDPLARKTEMDQL